MLGFFSKCIWLRDVTEGLRTTDCQLSASNATGSFQKSEPMQLGIPDGPFWSPNKSHEPNPKARDMTGLLAEDLREEAKAWCL
jgi:hypothetical protein